MYTIGPESEGDFLNWKSRELLIVFLFLVRLDQINFNDGVKLKKKVLTAGLKYSLNKMELLRVVKKLAFLLWTCLSTLGK